MLETGFLMLGAIEWDKLTEGLKTAFEDGVEQALPIAAVIIAALLVFRTIRRFVKA